MNDNSDQAQQIEDQTTFIIASNDDRKVVRMIDVLNDLDMEKLATFRAENKAQGFETTVAQFDSEEDAGERYDEITARYANLAVTTPVNEFDPRHP